MIRKLLLAIALATVFALVALACTFTPNPLPLPSQTGIPLPPRSSEVATIGVIETGTMESNALFAYRGGGFEDRTFGMDVFVVRHPKGTILIEAGFGRNINEHLKTVPWLMRMVSKVHPAPLLVDQLATAGLHPDQLKGVFLTHAHWDHVGALQDLPGVPVYVNETERRFIDQGGDATALIRSFAGLNYHVFRFDGPAYAGFPSSYDVFGDGAVVIVPAGGHTPGSQVVFVRTKDQDYAFIGDQAWQREGVNTPTEKPWMSREMVDDDAPGVRTNLIKLHQLQLANPKLLIVPSHDRRITSTLPRVQPVSAPAANPPTTPSNPG